METSKKTMTVTTPKSPPPKATVAKKTAATTTTTGAAVKSAATATTGTAEKPAATAPTKVVKRKELVERIAAKSGAKPNLIKSVLDAVLQELGDVLSAGEVLQVQPLGKVSVNRRKVMPGREVLICKMRRNLPNPTVPETTIKAAE